ncbi:MAG: AsmA-like C-terminal region-containing protein [Sphingobacteriaceae bacterium]|nr:AsmA-like C-terminal region-containing protein [Sphingobacteriaceae bacterium]
MVKSKVEELKRNVLSENASLELQASLKDLVIQFKKQKDSTNIYSCELRALDRLVEVKDLSIKKGNSDLKINGKVEGAFNYILDDKNPLKIHGDLKSELIVVEDFIYDEVSATKKSEVDVPDNINFILDASIDALSFGKFNAAKLQGNIELKNKKIMAESLNLNTMDGNATIDALLDLNGKNLEVSMHGEMAKINVSKLFAQLNNFDQETLKDNNVGGLLSASIDFSGTWDKFLEPDLNSMKATSDLQIEQGRLVDFKPLESLAKFVDINDLKSIKFSSLQSRVEISKSIITIPKTAIKNSALNIDFWGTHSFNNDIDYHIQLLIGDYLNKKRKPDADYEFALVENDPENRRSAFILMTGTVDKPIIKYDRKGMKQKIKEDIKNEKQNLKAILKEEFGMFKKDSIKVKTNPKSDQQFKLEDPKKKKDPEKEEEDEDF